MLDVDSLNALPLGEFASALKPLFETAPPLAKALYAQRPFTSYAALVDTAESVTLEMSETDQIAILSAHPRIGADPSTLSAASFREQGYSTRGSADTSEAEQVLAELADLNAAYEEKFGFRFVVFVNRRPKSEIINVLRKRLIRTRQEELATGLQEMFRIARDRLATAT